MSSKCLLTWKRANLDFVKNKDFYTTKITCVMTEDDLKLMNITIMSWYDTKFKIKTTNIPNEYIIEINHKLDKPNLALLNAAIKSWMGGEIIVTKSQVKFMCNPMWNFIKCTKPNIYLPESFMNSWMDDLQKQAGSLFGGSFKQTIPSNN